MKKELKKNRTFMFYPATDLKLRHCKFKKRGIR